MCLYNCQFAYLAMLSGDCSGKQLKFRTHVITGFWCLMVNGSCFHFHMQASSSGSYVVTGDR